ncbi:MAG TPA: malto-oligosyltrehalose synthase [Acetobacteraceae bacterium]|nr:malto-oligosyltrehalose synthase [Acetobacteraceae bacterium]
MTPPLGRRRPSVRATMRLQLHRGFTFADAAGVVPYLAALGVSHLYASPILTARPGSMHGYDVIDPTTVSVELGGEPGLRRLIAALRGAGLGLIVDIVPNHMAVDGGDNPWWTDVLRHGRASRFASFFDIDWDCPDPDLRGKVLAPFLSKPYGAALADGEMKLTIDPSGVPSIRCGQVAYPIDSHDFAEVTAAGAGAYDTASAAGLARLHRLLERQHYRLAWWRVAGDEINWRRFFDINGLAALRMEDPAVFTATHATLFRLYAEGLIDGVRVDHVDGLADPPGYCRQLRESLAALEDARPAGTPPGPAYLVVEKILGAGESLPDDWPVDGTSGYDFMDCVSAVQHDPDAEGVLAAAWAVLSGRPAAFVEEEVTARREILEAGFAAQLAAASMSLRRLAAVDPATRDLSAPSIRRALVALLSHFAVYRTYHVGGDCSAGDETAIERAVAGAKADSRPSLHDAIEALGRWLVSKLTAASGCQIRRVAATQVQQLSAPLAAKAVEDTAFYRYGRLVSRNDVGFDASVLGIGPEDFHKACAERLLRFPDAMLATATHDHKRGEDVRARLAVLSEMPEAWEATLCRWMERNARHRRESDRLAPSHGDEVMLYQMIVGAWPLALRPDDVPARNAFVERLAAWQRKGMREAKLETDWLTPNLEYEEAAHRFLSGVMADEAGFLHEAWELVQRIAPSGAVNGLAQTVLKLTTPGVPDIFQGTEFWDLSLVDPDNRRPVDFAARIDALQAGDDPAALAAHWRDGRVKQAIIARVLALRASNPVLFAQGDYRPVMVQGKCPNRILSFIRCYENTLLLTVVPRLVRKFLYGNEILTIDPAFWNGSSLSLPPELSGRVLRELFTGCLHKPSGNSLAVSDVLATMPVAVLHSFESA